MKTKLGAPGSPWSWYHPRSSSFVPVGSLVAVWDGSCLRKSKSWDFKKWNKKKKGALGSPWSPPSLLFNSLVPVGSFVGVWDSVCVLCELNSQIQKIENAKN